MSNISKQHLEELIKDLVIEGEDSQELSLWIDLYDTMEDTEKIELINNLENELKELQKLK